MVDKGLVLGLVDQQTVSTAHVMLCCGQNVNTLIVGKNSNIP